MSDFDVMVIGGGSAGYAAARSAAQAGAKVAIVEGAKEVGGLCILRGCMPTKTLLESSNRWNEIKHAADFGLRVKAVKPDIRKIYERKDSLIQNFAQYRREQLKKGPFTFLRGSARFTDPYCLEIQSAKGRKQYRAKTFVIATGSEIKPVLIPGLEKAGYLTSDSALKLKKLPKSLIILGGGAIAVEFAQFFQYLGVSTTIIQRSPHLLKDFDSDIGQSLEAAFISDGANIFTQTRILKVGKRGNKKTVTFDHQNRSVTVAAEEIFYALGRRPALGNLSLEKIGLDLSGEIIHVDYAMRTSSPHIFAAGDVTSHYEVVHIAVNQGEIAGWNAAQFALGNPQNPRKIDYRLNTVIIFTQPEIASTGLTELQAKTQGIDYLSATYPFNDHGKSMIMGAKYGFVKLLAEKTRGEIIGSHIIGPHASDLIHELIAVMYYRGTVHDLLKIPHYHPTLSEIITYPAEEIADQLLLKPSN